MNGKNFDYKNTGQRPRIFILGKNEPFLDKFTRKRIIGQFGTENVYIDYKKHQNQIVLRRMRRSFFQFCDFGIDSTLAFVLV